MLEQFYWNKIMIGLVVYLKDTNGVAAKRLACYFSCSLGDHTRQIINARPASVRGNTPEETIKKKKQYRENMQLAK